MGLTHFPNGVTSFGMPQIGSGPLLTTSRVFFLNSTTPGATDGNDGLDPDRPCATMNGVQDAVLAQRATSTTSEGEIVIIGPGHAESLDAATDVVIDVVGLKFIGVGRGSIRPTFTFSGTAGSFEIDAADTYIENVIFMAGISAVVVGVNVDADHCTIQNCEWNFSTTAFDFVIMMDIDTVTGTKVLNNKFVAESATAGADHAIRLDTSPQTEIIGNHMTGDFAAGVITSEGAASVQITIAHNFIYNDDTAFTTGNGIDLTVADTGLLAYNSVGTLQAVNVYTLIDSGSCLSIENYVVNAIDEKAVSWPELASAST